eukprot:TCONS_00066289-protein
MDRAFFTVQRSTSNSKGGVKRRDDQNNDNGKSEKQVKSDSSYSAFRIVELVNENQALKQERELRGNQNEKIEKKMQKEMADKKMEYQSKLEVLERELTAKDQEVFRLKNDSSWKELMKLRWKAIELQAKSETDLAAKEAECKLLKRELALKEQRIAELQYVDRPQIGESIAHNVARADKVGQATRAEIEPLQIMDQLEWGLRKFFMKDKKDGFEQCDLEEYQDWCKAIITSMEDKKLYKTDRFFFIKKAFDLLARDCVTFVLMKGKGSHIEEGDDEIKVEDLPYKVWWDEGKVMLLHATNIDRCKNFSQIDNWDTLVFWRGKGIGEEFYDEQNQAIIFGLLD